MNERSGEKFSPLVRPIFIVSTMTAIKFSAASIQKAPQTAVTSVATAYPWAAEIEKTIVQSLVTTFGLDFLLFQDKIGGDVDTVHNVRRGIFSSDIEEKRYKEREEYSDVKSEYHRHDNYIATGRRDKQLQQEGMLHDPYRNIFISLDEKINLDHVISAKEIHDDPGRILAGLSGVALANQDTNLQTTQESINKSKKQSPMHEYIKKLPDLIRENNKNIECYNKQLQALSNAPYENRANIEKLKAKIRKAQKKGEMLESIDEKAMLERDRKARSAYDRSINQAYYQSSKFFKKTAIASATAAVSMGTRQVLGLVCAEIWFELKEAIPAIFEKIKSKFCLDDFFVHVKITLKKIWQRIKMRFRDFLTEFKDGAIGGALSSVTTTIFNIFATTGKGAIKIIREMWGHLTKALKLIFFNPENLSLIDLGKAVTGVLATGVSALAGSMVYANLVPVLSFPMGGELATFAGALVTGLLTLGLNHFLLHSDLAKKAWAYLESRMPHAELLRKYKEANAEIDRYLAELGNIEFNLDLEDLASFATQLESSENEEEKATVLKEQTDKMKIDLPFEPGNFALTRKFLAGKI